MLPLMVTTTWSRSLCIKRVVVANSSTRPSPTLTCDLKNISVLDSVNVSLHSKSLAGVVPLRMCQKPCYEGGLEL